MNRKMNIPLQICVHVCKHTWLSVYVIDNICIYFAYSKNFHISKFFVYPKTGRQTTANNHNCEKRGNNFTRYFWKLYDERVIGYVCKEHQSSRFISIFQNWLYFNYIYTLNYIVVKLTNLNIFIIDKLCYRNFMYNFIYFIFFKIGFILIYIHSKKYRC